MSSEEEPTSAVLDSMDLAIEQKSQRKSFRRFWDLLDRSIRLAWSAGRALFLALVGLQMLAAIALSGQVFVIKVLLERVLRLSGSAVSTVVLPVLLLAVCTALTSIIGAVQSNVQRLLAERVARSMWHPIFDVSTGVNLRHFESAGFYDRLQRVQANGLTRPFQVTQGLLALIGALAGAIGVSVAIITLNPLLLPLLVLGGIPMLLTSRKESRLEFTFTVAQTQSQRMRIYLTWLQTNRDEAKEIRAFNLAGSLRRRFDTNYAGYLRDLAAHLRRRTGWNTLGNTSSAVVLAATLMILMWLVSRGNVGVAAAGAAIVAIRMLASQIQSAFGAMQQIFESGLFLDDVEAFMRLGPASAREAAGAQAPKGFGSLKAAGVSFRYPGSDRSALSAIDLHINAGEIIALVGENGSGKTTLAKLLAGLYEPDGGKILWDGVDERKFRRSSIRDRVAVIFQDFVHYAWTAEENIAIGRADEPIDPARVRAAAEAAGAWDLIQALPEGSRTPLSRMFSGGRDLSGGQWQRIALARAFYRDAPLVILDEPSSALDPRAEHALFSTLREMLDGRSALFISHRFSTVRAADRIYVLEAGRITESGSHSELMALGGRYAELFGLQAAAYLPDESDPAAAIHRETGAAEMAH